MTTFKEIRNRIREHKKELVKTIKAKKADGWRHCYERKEFRQFHIAYCEFFRGKTRDQIEIPRDCNALSSYDNKMIENLKAGWKSEIQSLESENA